MKETYYLNQEKSLPRMPVPGDNIISSVTLEDQFITFALETDIRDKDDSIQWYKPGAKRLIIRYHLAGKDGFVDLYKMKRSPRHLSWLIPPRFISLDGKRLAEFTNGKHTLVYIRHYVDFNSIIIMLHSATPIQLEAEVDYIEYEWFF